MFCVLVRTAGTWPPCSRAPQSLPSVGPSLRVCFGDFESHRLVSLLWAACPRPSPLWLRATPPTSAPGASWEHLNKVRRGLPTGSVVSFQPGFWRHQTSAQLTSSASQMLNLKPRPGTHSGAPRSSPEGAGSPSRSQKSSRTVSALPRARRGAPDPWSHLREEKHLPRGEQRKSHSYRLCILFLKRNTH